MDIAESIDQQIVFPYEQLLNKYPKHIFSNSTD
jgi:hypothetical protein